MGTPFKNEYTKCTDMKMTTTQHEHKVLNYAFKIFSDFETRNLLPIFLWAEKSQSMPHCF
jgi:hypothetical protein